MGMEHLVQPGPTTPPLWPRLAEFLAQRAFPVEIRMIDDQLAFPDEMPPDDWRELRLGTTHGMVTVRRDEGQLRIVTWGNADAGMQQAWNAIAWAVAAVTDGTIQTAARTMNADEFRRTTPLPPAMTASNSC